jgi:hypothetical protein
MSEVVHVSLDREATDAEVEAVRAVFAEAGLGAEVEANYIRLSAGTLPYVVDLVVKGVPWLAAAYVLGAAQAAGQDSWEAFRDGGWRGLQRFVRSIGHARPDRQGHITVRSADAPVVVLTPDLSEASLRELGDLDWSELTAGQLAWNEEANEWWWLPPGGSRAGPAPKRQLDGA